jgi:hypothetical protein
MESAWLNVLTGISQGSFDTLFVKDANGNWINILTLGASGGGGGSGVVQSAQAPLYITNGVISVDLASYLTSNQITTLLTAYSTTTQINAMLQSYVTATLLNNTLANYSTTAQMNTALTAYIPITHESYKIGTANVGFGAFDINTRTLTLQNAAGVTALLTVDNGGNLKINNSGVTTVAYVSNEFATHEYNSIIMKDSNNVLRSLIPSIAGPLTYGGSSLVDLNILNTELAGKVSNSRVLTDVPANALFSDTLYNHPSQHPISMITGLQTALDSKVGQLNFVAPMTGSTSGSAITIETLFKPSSVSAGANILLVADDALGTLTIASLASGGFTEQDIRDRIIANVNVLGTSAQSKLIKMSTPATGVFLTVDPTEWATKQDLLASYTESSATGSSLIFSDEANSVWIPFNTSGSPVNVSGSHTQLTVNPSFGHLTLQNTATTGSYTFSLDVKGGTCTNLVMDVMDTVTWATMQVTNFTGLTSSWQTFTWNITPYANGKMDFHWGWGAIAGITQSVGTVHVRNLSIAAPSTSAVTISSNLTTANITSSGTVQCVSLVQTSDASIKQNVVDANLAIIQSVFDSVEVKTYERTDIPGQPRIGFIANEVVDALDETGFDNIARMTYDTGNPLWGLDYARLTTILWGVCKKQQMRLDQVEARLAALES